jgi:hypothetical protein
VIFFDDFLRATSDKTIPGVQYPHCAATCRSKEFWMGSSFRLSIVLIFIPSTCRANLMHESVGSPPTSTVQAPQSPRSHPCFVPVSPRSVRKISSRERCGEIHISCSCSLTMKFRRVFIMFTVAVLLLFMVIA